MPTKLNPYLNFNGQTNDALQFYKTVFGGNLTTTSYKDGGMPHDPADASKIMHGVLDVENGIVIMGSDSPDSKTTGSNISLSLNGEDEAELRGYWDKLSVGGSIEQPLVAAPWGDMFGMLTDRFGIHWMVNISAKKA